MAKTPGGLNVHIARRHRVTETPGQQAAADRAALEAAFTPPPPPAGPPPIELYAAGDERFTCGRCGSSAFASSVSDPTICVRCDIARKQLARQDTSPFVCRDCRRDTVAPAPTNPAICVQCARRAAQAAD